MGNFLHASSNPSHSVTTLVGEVGDAFESEEPRTVAMQVPSYCVTLEKILQWKDLGSALIVN